jgi:hypothetical protein
VSHSYLQDPISVKAVPDYMEMESRVGAFVEKDHVVEKLDDAESLDFP